MSEIPNLINRLSHGAMISLGKRTANAKRRMDAKFDADIALIVRRARYAKLCGIPGLRLNLKLEEGSQNAFAIAPGPGPLNEVTIENLLVGMIRANSPYFTGIGPGSSN